ncbi:hypothetical protein [Shimia sp. MIT910701]|jgi:hypothetical protein|uniref:hypothetical protein n=1 Tax=Shimia sp. MIT910701 TaxID=3096987 RepID=UPI00399A1094
MNFELGDVYGAEGSGGAGLLWFAAYIAAILCIRWCLGVIGKLKAKERFTKAAIGGTLGAGLGVLAIGVPVMLLQEFGLVLEAETFNASVQVGAAVFFGWWGRASWGDTA